MRTSDCSVKRGSRAPLFILAGAAGLLACVTGIQLANLSLKDAAVALCALGVVPLAIATNQIRNLLLFGWIVSLAYFRAFYPIESMAGFQGFFVTISDALLLALLGVWVLNAAILKNTGSRPGAPVWCFTVPFLAIAAISAAGAERSDWAAYEFVRVAAILPILLFCRFNLKATQWWAAIGAFGASIAVQASYGILQVTTHLGHYEPTEYDLYRRAGGTLGHANLLGSYLLLLSPTFLALAPVARPRVIKIACAVTGLLGFIGIAATISRGPWLLAALEIVALAAGLLWIGALTLKQVLGIAGTGGVAILLILAPMSGWIESHMRNDVKESIDFRVRLDGVALDILRSHPLFGVGLDNFPIYLRTYDMPFSDSLDDAMEVPYSAVTPEQQINGLAVQSQGSWWAWVPHNIYLLLLAETGLLGLVTFLLYIGAGLFLGLRAVLKLSGAWRCACLGLLIGMLAVLGHMLIDYALWLDPMLYTFTFIIGLLAAAPALEQSAGAKQLAADFSLRLQKLGFSQGVAAGVSA